MKSLSLADQIFLWLEKRQQPMHVGGLHLYSFPEDAGPKYVTELAEYMSSFDQPIAPFNQRLQTRFGHQHLLSIIGMKISISIWNITFVIAPYQSQGESGSF